MRCRLVIGCYVVCFIGDVSIAVVVIDIVIVILLLLLLLLLYS